MFQRVAMVLRAPARMAIPASPNVARLSPAAVSQALRTSSSIGVSTARCGSSKNNKSSISLAGMRDR